MKILMNNVNYTGKQYFGLSNRRYDHSANNHTANMISYAYPIFQSKTTTKLYEEYNWYINHDKTPAIKAFLKIQETPEVMDRFLTEILKTKDRSKEFFDSFVYSPRETSSLFESLKQRVGSNSAHLMPFRPDSVYNKAYKEYLDYKYNNERSIVSLLKIRPDWRGKVLINKHKSLYGNENLTIGNIPKDFPRNHLALIVNYLRDKMEYGLKQKKKIPSLTLDNREYEFVFFTEGRSDKNVFGVFTPEGRKYVFKMGEPEARSLDAPFALGTLAKIDTYLTTHNCRNSAPLCYYNHAGNFSVYKYIEHLPTNERPTLANISKHLNDFRALGLTYNDTVGDKNFFILKPDSADYIHNTVGFAEGVANKEWISVDNDHVTYSNPLQPVIYEYCNFLPNAMQMFL